MVYSTYHSFSQTFDTGNTEVNMNTIKYFTRLSQVFFTLSNSAVDINTAAGTFFRRKWTWFFHPMAAVTDSFEGVTDSDRQNFMLRADCQ